MTRKSWRIFVKIRNPYSRQRNDSYLVYNKRTPCNRLCMRMRKRCCPYSKNDGSTPIILINWKDMNYQLNIECSIRCIGADPILLDTFKHQQPKGKSLDKHTE